MYDLLELLRRAGCLLLAVLGLLPALSLWSLVLFSELSSYDYLRAAAEQAQYGETLDGVLFWISNVLAAACAIWITQQPRHWT